MKRASYLSLPPPPAHENTPLNDDVNDKRFLGILSSDGVAGATPALTSGVLLALDRVLVPLPSGVGELLPFLAPARR